MSGFALALYSLERNSFPREIGFKFNLHTVVAEEEHLSGAIFSTEAALAVFCFSFCRELLGRVFFSSAENCSGGAQVCSGENKQGPRGLL
jgi:hypothetical protein